MNEATGETEDNGEEAPTEKAYCCSNYPNTEAALIAKFDLALETIGLLAFVISIATVASKDSPTLISQSHSNDQHNKPVLNTTTSSSDPSMFFHWPREAQLIVMSLSLVCCAVGIVFSVILWMGVRKKNHAFLLTWFIFTLVCVLIFVIIGIVVIIKAGDKLMASVSTVSFFLYKWYCLWIVKLLMSEIRGVREGYANPLDDGEMDHVNNLVPNSDSFNVDKF